MGNPAVGCEQPPATEATELKSEQGDVGGGMVPGCMESFPKVLSPRQKIKVFQQTWLELTNTSLLPKAGQVTSRARGSPGVPGARTGADAVQSQACGLPLATLHSCVS